MTSQGFPYTYFYFFSYTYYNYSNVVTTIFVYVFSIVDLTIKIVVFSEILKELGKAKTFLAGVVYQEYVQSYQQQYGQVPPPTQYHIQQPPPVQQPVQPPPQEKLQEEE